MDKKTSRGRKKSTGIPYPVKPYLSQSQIDWLKSQPNQSQAIANGINIMMSQQQPTLTILDALNSAQQFAENCQWAEAIEALKTAKKLCSPSAVAGANANYHSLKSGGKLVNLRDNTTTPACIDGALPWLQQYADERRDTPSSIARVLIGTAIGECQV